MGGHSWLWGHWEGKGGLYPHVRARRPDGSPTYKNCHRINRGTGAGGKEGGHQWGLPKSSPIQRWPSPPCSGTRVVSGPGVPGGCPGPCPSLCPSCPSPAPRGSVDVIVDAGGVGGGGLGLLLLAGAEPWGAAHQPQVGLLLLGLAGLGVVCTWGREKGKKWGVSGRRWAPQQSG